MNTQPPATTYQVTVVCCYQVQITRQAHSLEEAMELACRSIAVEPCVEYYLKGFSVSDGPVGSLVHATQLFNAHMAQLRKEAAERAKSPTTATGDRT